MPLRSVMLLMLIFVTVPSLSEADSLEIIGCYEQDSVRVLPVFMEESVDMTDEECQQLCREQQYTFSGVDGGKTCYCGDEGFESCTPVDCGPIRSGLIVISWVCPMGKYGANCELSCSCPGDVPTCMVSNGECYNLALACTTTEGSTTPPSTDPPSTPSPPTDPPSTPSPPTDPPSTPSPPTDPPSTPSPPTDPPSTPSPPTDPPSTSTSTTSAPPPKKKRTSYIRWGRTMCPAGSQKLYSGYMAGSDNSRPGGGANYLCAHESPQFVRGVAGHQDPSANLYGVEFEIGFSQTGLFFTTNLPPSSVLNNQDVVCVVCYVENYNSTDELMIPGRQDCASTGYNLQYKGFLVSAANPLLGGGNRGEFICMDEAPEGRSGGSGGSNQGEVSPVEVNSGSLPNSPYQEGMEMTCAVCTQSI